MKQITPIQYTNEEILAEHIKVIIIEDDLETFARFAWWMFSADMTLVDDGIVRCEGTDYSTWTGHNEFPYTFVADTLGLEII